MIEDCSDLLQCENRLSKEVQNVSLLGQIALSPEDLDHLGTLIRRTISSDISQGTRFLEREAPTCLACFLVWVGIVGYRDGDYWSAVWESTGLAEDPNWERKWGKVFLAFLKANDLPLLDIEGGLTYVTPILAHGGIPNSCLDEFFKKALLPMVQRDLIDPTDLGEIVYELAVRRKDDEERARVERQYDDLWRRTRSLAGKVRLARRIAEVYDEVIELWRFEESTKNLDALANLPEDYEAFRNRKLADLSSLEEEIHGFEQKQTHYQHVVAKFTEQDKQVLAQAEVIERSISEYPALKEQQRIVSTLETKEGELTAQLSSQSIHIFSELWNNGHGELLTRLPFDALRGEIRRFEAIGSRQDEIQKKLDHFRALSRARLILAFILTGFIWWYWYRQTVRRLEQALKQTTSERQRVQETITKTLGNLPIAEQQLRSPSPELYQALVSLADVYRELCETRNRRVQLQQEIHQHAQRVKQTAINADIQPTHGLDDAICAMERALKEARERQAAAAHAAKELEDDVRPKVADLNAKYRAIREELAQAEKRLAEMGGGDIQAGIERVKAQRRLQDTAAKLRTELKERYPDLETIERETRNAQRTGKDKTALEAEARHLTKQVEKIQAQAGRLKQELSYYPAAFPGVDEPIRRYLLYGGKSAEEFLVRSVLLAHQALTEGKVPNADDVGLPERVVKAFKHWYIQYEPPSPPEDEIDATTGQRFRAPTISLDPGMAEVMVHFHAQRYLASIAGTSACLEVVGFDSDSQRQTFPLRVYKGAEGLLETQEPEPLPLPFPADRYEFSLKSDGIVIHQWEVAAMRSEAPYMAFDRRSGKLIKDKELPKREIWFLVRQDFSLEPADCILVEGGSLYGQWKDYIFLELDLDQVDELQIVDDQGQRFLIPISPERSPTLDLIGGQRLEGVHSEGVEIRVGPSPRIRVPIEDEVELRLWRLSIFPGEESSPQDRKHYQLSELQEALDVHTDEGWVDILLPDETLLGQRPVGRFTIRVRKPPYTDWRSTFCAVPDLQVEFDRVIYLPYEAGKTPDIYAKILVAERAEFAPQPPAELFDTRDNLYAVRIDGTENTLSGTLYLHSLDRGKQRIPLAIRIPKVRWRLQGLADDQYATWRDTIEEVWLGDWETASELFLVVELPPSVDGHLKLALGDDSGKEDEKKIHEGKARFDLLAFGDALRTGPSVQTFTLMHPESQFGIEHVPLFKVRTRWEVEDVECVQESQGRTVILNVTWTEKGRTGNKDRIVRLWSSSGVPADPIRRQKVSEGKQSVKLRANVRDLLPGTYLLQLTVEDPWATTEVSRPTPTAPNTHVIEIVPIGDIRQGEVLSIRSIADDHGQLCQLDEGMYRIRILGKIINRTLPTDVGAEPVLVTRTNEGWYVGNLEAAADPGLEAEVEKANPVKFEYDVSKDQITAIEDRYGEGAMYCRRCCKLYWSQEMNTEEEQKGHPLFGPVEVFKINWES